ncbi:probable non-ribosomal peptide synthetase modules and related proteins [Rhynchosporium agropyri]|uniref:Probable non-ribosomal peptide synthetase modules and related proteins n=1 Tax=Rhynchosporium agropyri TaxID=914238 RepID=A0A1E1KZ77_9HELO|nr:probable non-ribosomal peptide synthetase modules and related proteins [Rhynchosporium agropyri]
MGSIQVEEPPAERPDDSLPTNNKTLQNLEEPALQSDDPLFTVRNTVPVEDSALQDLQDEQGLQEEHSPPAVIRPGKFEIPNLAAPFGVPTPTSTREATLLLAWLIVLLRTREGSVKFDWTYLDNDGVEQEVAMRCLNMEEVIPGLESTVEEASFAIARYIQAVEPRNTEPGSKALLLSSTSFENEEKEGLQLKLQYRGSNLEITAIRHPTNMLPFTISHHISTLNDTIQLCLSSPSSTISSLLSPTKSDLSSIWSWTSPLPPTYNTCMHTVITARAQTHPSKTAISSWDGDLTYAQIDRYSSILAGTLRDMGVKLHDFMPICFEKSRWTIVAVLAVMKAGATMVMMDPSLPVARLQNMGCQVGANMVVCSRKQEGLAREIMPEGRFLVVDEETFVADEEVPVLEEVPSDALMYIIFTSGSTGTPKGVKISHATYTSSAFPRAKAVGYTEDSRVLDFASYAFDVSIDSMLLTVGNGGCLCIPSDEDRLNDINGAMRKMQVNYAGLTPSVARILEPDVIASLDGLGLGGEAASPHDVNLWGQVTRIIIGYGPCECTIGCTVNSSAATGRDYISIGPGNGAAIWIVDPNDHNLLMPVGAVGELLVEGPIVGQGYLNDPEKTAAAFIVDPPWLVAGHDGYPGRNGRLYKSGDIGMYDPDGSGNIVFVGRQDTQVKLRGQRVELSEIESQLKARLPSDINVIAEVITPQGAGGQPTLVAFIAPQSTKGLANDELKLAQLPEELRIALAKADVDVKETLPRYMVPNAYIPPSYIPVLISGKTDRKRLRAFGATVDLRQIDQSSSTAPSRDLNELERHLRHSWAEVLKIDAETIKLEGNFFALGGESLTAMKLVSVCRLQGLDLSVTSTFSKPTLETMASTIKISNPEAKVQTAAFSMISQDVEIARREAAEACQSEPSCIEDIHPCTPTQESLFTFSIRSSKAYIAQRVACIPSTISLDKWKKAWEDVVAASPILRTRLAQLQEPGLQQVALKGDVSWRSANDLKRYLEDDRLERMELGQDLARYAIVNSDGKQYMVWTIHHVLYDGWSEPLVLRNVSNALQGQPIEVQAQMKDFVKYIRDTDQVAMQHFWRRELNGATGPQFPRLPHRDYLATPDAFLEHEISLETAAGSPFTMATLIRGAWALVASQYTSSDDVVFGETLTGRDIPLPGVEEIVGPLVATLPIRIRINRTSTVESYLQTVQQRISARTPYQHMGWQNIRKVSKDAQHASEAGTGLVIQPEPEYAGSELGFEYGDVVREALHFNPYPLMVAFGIRKGGLRVCANFDSGLIDIAQMKRMLVQLEVACKQLSRGVGKKLKDISCLPEVDLDRIWQWNRVPPLALDEASNIRAHVSLQPGSIYPRAVVPWVCDPQNPSHLSPIGCAGELWLEGAIPGDGVQSPAWLLAGSSDHPGRTGNVQSTGDLVELQEDGNLVFVGRKENVLPGQGQATDIQGLESHIARHLSSNVRVATIVRNSEESLDPTIIVFIEQQGLEEVAVELLSASYKVTCDSGFQMTVSSKISAGLITGIKILDKSIESSFPSNMVPSAFVVVDRLPCNDGVVDPTILGQLASKIPSNVLTKLAEGFTKAWMKTAQNNLTPKEDILRSAWAKILSIDAEQIDVQDNFFRLGGDSVLAMKLVSSLRAQGHALSVANVFNNMRLGDAAKVMKVDQVSQQIFQPYKPFSTLGRTDIDLFLLENVKPKLADQTWVIQDVLPVTDSQALDIRGTVQKLRTSIQYTMLYLEKGIDREQIFGACKNLIKTHDILRTIFIEHESKFVQVVIEELDSPIALHQTEGDLGKYVTDLCNQDIDFDFKLGSSFLRLSHVEGKDGECLVIGLSHAQYDGNSLPILLRDLGRFYAGQNAIESVPFSSYMARIGEETVQAKAITYWKTLMKDSTLSKLEGASVQSTDKAIFRTKTVDISQRPEEITTANLLTAAWALVLARRLRKADVIFGSITSGRNIDLANAESVMGPCYQFTPVRVAFETHWTSLDLLKFVQTQSAQSSAHDFLGFDKISTTCTEWSSEAQFFDSIVHHQDFEDFDTMPFAGGSAKVDISNPHGDAAYPLKVVSFVRDGQTCVGVAGSENDVAFVDSSLAELAATVQELATREANVLLDEGMFKKDE